MTISRSSSGPGSFQSLRIRDLVVELPAHQAADLGPIEVQRLVELEHGAGGRFEDDRLATALLLVFCRALVAEDDRAGVELDAAVREVVVTLEEQLGLVAFENFRVLQFPRPRGKEPFKRLQPRVDEFRPLLPIARR